MKKLLNFRPFFIIAISMMVATAFATYVFIAQNLKLIIFGVLVGLSLIFAVLSAVFKRKFLVVFMAVFLFMAIPFVSVYAKTNKINKNLSLNSTTVELTGKISGNYKFTSSGNLEILIDNVTASTKEITKSIDGKVAIYTNPTSLDLTKFKSGACVKIKTSLNFFTLDAETSKSLNYLTRGISASGYAMFYNISLTGENDETVRDKICSAVFNKLSSENVKYAEIGYAMLFGDSNVLESNIKNSFRATGIAHLLAVSGLHVSIIILMINFILKKLKVNNKVNLAVSLVILAFYCYLCNFSVSVIRASLMALFALYAKCRGKAYDNLSVLSLIVVIVLLISPLHMFNISFVLSFSAVLSIILLSKPLTKILNKVFYEKLSNTFALNLSVQIGLIATNLFFFGKYPVFGIFANLVAVPVATTGFIILIAGLLLSFVIPFMSFVMLGYSALMDIVVKFNNFVTKIGFNIALGNISFVVILLMFALMFILSDYCFAKKKYKLISSLSILASCLCLVFV